MKLWIKKYKICAGNYCRQKQKNSNNGGGQQKSLRSGTENTPGITGLAQVNGLRGETESLDKMTRRIEHDLQYMRHWSLMLDIKILFKTIFSMSGNNVY